MPQNCNELSKLPLDCAFISYINCLKGLGRASVISVSVTLFRSKFKFKSVTSSSTCLLKRVNLHC